MKKNRLFFLFFLLYSCSVQTVYCQTRTQSDETKYTRENLKNKTSIPDLHAIILRLQEENEKLQNRINKQNRNNKMRTKATIDTMVYVNRIKALENELDEMKQFRNDYKQSGMQKKNTMVNIADTNFKRYLLRYHDVDMDGKITLWDMEHIYIMDISRASVSGVFNREIRNLKGIELCVNLQKLVCSNNKLIGNLDLSANKKLKKLCVDHCQLDKIDISSNSDLSYLDCSYNKITTLNLSQNPKLEYVDCQNNKISNLDLSNNKELRYLYASCNDLVTLDLSVNEKLNEVKCNQNKLEIVTCPPTTISLMDVRINPLQTLNGLDRIEKLQVDQKFKKTHGLK